MKSIKLFLIISTLFISFLSNGQVSKKKASFKTKSSTKKSVANQVIKYKIDVTKSSIEWLAKKVTGQHNGITSLSSGTLQSNGKLLKGGSFVIDMNTIEVLDLEGEYKGKLTNHLKSDDFFSVEKFPTSNFVITKITGNNITGNLTIKGITNSITFPAAIIIDKNVITANAKAIIDRTKFDIKYNSKSIFSSIGDKAIDDEISLTIKILATKD
jgi:polyisoprenoid-binding protein YceI